MKKTLLTLFITLVAFTVNAQSDTTANKIYIAADKAPEFPGGMSEFVKYLERNVNYPPQSRTRGKQGKAIVRFVVEKDGSITNAKVLRPIAKDIDAEAVRVITNSPKWNPGIVNGEPVRTQFTYPINFVLPPNSSSPIYIQ